MKTWQSFWQIQSFLFIRSSILLGIHIVLKDCINSFVADVHKVFQRFITEKEVACTVFLVACFSFAICFRWSAFAKKLEIEVYLLYLILSWIALWIIDLKWTWRRFVFYESIFIFNAFQWYFQPDKWAWEKRWKIKATVWKYNFRTQFFRAFICRLPFQISPAHSK